MEEAGMFKKKIRSLTYLRDARRVWQWKLKMLLHAHTIHEEGSHHHITRKFDEVRTMCSSRHKSGYVRVTIWSSRGPRRSCLVCEETEDGAFSSPRAVVQREGVPCVKLMLCLDEYIYIYIYIYILSNHYCTLVICTLVICKFYELINTFYLR